MSFALVVVREPEVNVDALEVLELLTELSSIEEVTVPIRSKTVAPTVVLREPVQVQVAEVMLAARLEIHTPVMRVGLDVLE